jgi:hypothetical protein
MTTFYFLTLSGLGWTPSVQIFLPIFAQNNPPQTALLNSLTRYPFWPAHLSFFFSGFLRVDMGCGFLPSPTYVPPISSILSCTFTFWFVWYLQSALPRKPHLVHDEPQSTLHLAVCESLLIKWWATTNAPSFILSCSSFTIINNSSSENHHHSMQLNKLHP